MIVMMIAITASLNASSRVLPMAACSVFPEEPDGRLPAAAGVCVIPELDALDDAILPVDVDRPRLTARANGVLHSHFLAVAIPEVNDDPLEVDRCPLDRQLDLLERSALSRYRDYIVIGTVGYFPLAEHRPPALRGCGRCHRYHKAS